VRLLLAVSHPRPPSHQQPLRPLAVTFVTNPVITPRPPSATSTGAPITGKLNGVNIPTHTAQGANAGPPPSVYAPLPPPQLPYPRAQTI